MKIYDKNPDEYLQGQQVIMELCMDMHTSSGQNSAVKNYFRKCFGVMFYGICSSTIYENKSHGIRSQSGADLL